MLPVASELTLNQIVIFPPAFVVLEVEDTTAFWVLPDCTIAVPVTHCPAIGLPYASVTCAVIVTHCPAPVEYLLESAVSMAGAPAVMEAYPLPSVIAPEISWAVIVMPLPTAVSI